MKYVCVWVWWWWVVCISQSEWQTPEPSQSFLKCKKNSSGLSIWSPRKMLNWLTTCSHIESDIICPLLWPWTFAFTRRAWVHVAVRCENCSFCSITSTFICNYTPSTAYESKVIPLPYRSYHKLESHEISCHVFSCCQRKWWRFGLVALSFFSRSLTCVEHVKLILQRRYSSFVFFWSKFTQWSIIDFVWWCGFALVYFASG